MAAPHVAAVASMLKQVNGDLSAKDVADIILTTADNQAGTKWKEGDGYRYLNAEAAVKEAINRRPIPNCESGVTIKRDANSASIDDLDSWGSITCTIGGNFRYVSMRATEQHLYIKYEEGRAVYPPYSYQCVRTLGGAWSCSGFAPIPPVTFDMNGNRAVDEGADFTVSIATGWNNEDQFRQNGCSVWLPPDYTQAPSNPPAGYVQKPFVFGGAAKLFTRGNSGIGVSSCVGFNMNFGGTPRLENPHYTYAYVIPWSRLSRGSTGTFRLIVGGYDIRNGGFNVEVQ